MNWSLFFGELVSGLTLGSIYALIALGYTMVYGILKLLNFAHGDVYMIGAFVAFFVLQWLGGPPSPGASARRAGAGPFSRAGRYRLARDRDHVRRRDVGLRGARGRHRALRLPAAARGAPNCAADQRARRLDLPPEQRAPALGAAVPRLRHLRPDRREELQHRRELLHLEHPDPHDLSVDRVDDRARPARGPHAGGQGDASRLVRPRGGGD